MKYINVVLFAFLLGCGQNYSIVTGDKGDSCVTTHDAVNIYVTCGDTISSIARPQNGADGSQGAQGLAGTNGVNGTNGTNGLNGHNTLVTTLSTSSCSNGGTTLLMGLDVNNDNVLQGSEVTSSAQVCNGHNGTNGTNGHDAPPTPFTPVDYVQPCGASSSPYKEVLLILENGYLLSSFSDNVNGYNTRFAFIPDGSYVDTDSSHCAFSVSTIGHTRKVSWSGGSKSWTF